MDERIRFVIRLQDGKSTASLCREFGMSRKTGCDRRSSHVGFYPILFAERRGTRGRAGEKWRRESGSNRRIIALQAMALPLGYPAL